MKKKKILFIASHRPDRAPGQRFRFEQYLAPLENAGFECEISYIVDEEADKILYARGKYFKKALIQLRSVRKRKKDAARAKNFSIIFIFREALMTGSTRFEKMFSDSGAKIIFDFDDAIWHLDVSEANRIFSWLKNPEKTGDIIGMSDLVFAGNEYLAAFAKKTNPNVVVIPTTVDTSKFQPVKHHNNNEKIIIGWSGSITTIKHFEFAVPFLKKLKEKYGDHVGFKVIGDPTYRNEELGIKGIAWNAKSEVNELAEIDIGIMPLPDNEWTKGKCGLKGLTYMALGIPAIMSAVGVNVEIINDGENGFLARTGDEWLEKIEKLISSEDLRRKMGEKAAKTVEDRYSVNAWKEKYVNYFCELLR
ncbi:MAG: glycosyltransferase family 4 protein [Bacteroidetes bacterium]|nr:glycosyltransferase family 4 protein [Bacteroidota bacterium]